MPPIDRQMDRAAALSALSGVEHILTDLATMFCEDAPKSLADLSQCIERGDFSGARQLAHTVKGRAAAFFASPTVKCAADLEAALGRDCSPHELQTKLQSLVAHVDGLCDELREICD